jgi:hypothetical protein
MYSPMALPEYSSSMYYVSIEVDACVRQTKREMHSTLCMVLLVWYLQPPTTNSGDIRHRPHWHHHRHSVFVGRFAPYNHRCSLRRTHRNQCTSPEPSMPVRTHHSRFRHHPQKSCRTDIPSCCCCWSSVANVLGRGDSTGSSLPAGIQRHSFHSAIPLR